MTFEDYQNEAVKFRTATANNEEYLVLGLIEEVGEAAGKLAKRRRDGVFDKKAFVRELGDILWFVANYADYFDREDETNYSLQLRDCFEMTVNVNYTDEEIMKDLAVDATGWVEGFDSAGNVIYELACLAKRQGFTLEQVAEINLAKLRDRAARGKIHGNGDER